MKKFNVVNIIVITILLIALGFTTTLAVRYWNEVSKLGNITISIGSVDGVELTIVNISEAFNGVLVPEGCATYVGEVEEVEFTYSVSLNKEVLNAQNLIIEAFDVTIDNDTEYAHLVQVYIEDELGRKELDYFNEVVTIKIVVKILEPIDAIEAAEKGKEANVENSEIAFEKIRGKHIGISLRFSIEPKK
ncbi:MAG: hypothetical protein WCS22_04350 [Acholeplasmataceae bacterium]